MMHDDVAYHPRNPFPGKLFNRYDDSTPPEDIYEGCNVDSSDITDDKFVDLLLGRSPLLQPDTTGTLVAFLTGHGLPDGRFHIETTNGSEFMKSERLIEVIQEMHKTRMYKNRLLI